MFDTSTNTCQLPVKKRLPSSSEGVHTTVLTIVQRMDEEGSYNKGVKLWDINSYEYEIIVYSFSLAAALLLPIKRLIEVKGLPTHRDSATLHSGVTELHYLLVIPFVRV